MASDSRKEGSSMKKAAEVVNKLTKEIDNQMVQIGGDSTTGRGQILFHSVEVEVEAAAGEK
jgi:CRISPR/Cas system CMR subunit Cmr4 (Cas7 group RAMP superfamily)